MTAVKFCTLKLMVNCSIASSISTVHLDNRKYYWPNYDRTEVHHEKFKFVYLIPVSPSKVINHSGAFYVTTITESLLLTWVGMKANIQTYWSLKHIFQSLSKAAIFLVTITNQYLSTVMYHHELNSRNHSMFIS